MKNLNNTTEPQQSDETNDTDQPKDMFAVIEEVMHDLLTEVAIAYNEKTEK